MPSTRFLVCVEAVLNEQVHVTHLKSLLTQLYTGDEGVYVAGVPPLLASQVPLTAPIE